MTSWSGIISTGCCRPPGCNTFSRTGFCAFQRLPSAWSPRKMPPVPAAPHPPAAAPTTGSPPPTHEPTPPPTIPPRAIPPNVIVERPTEELRNGTDDPLREGKNALAPTLAPPMAPPTNPAHALLRTCDQSMLFQPPAHHWSTMLVVAPPTAPPTAPVNVLRPKKLRFELPKPKLRPRPYTAPAAAPPSAAPAKPPSVNSWPVIITCDACTGPEGHVGEKSGPTAGVGVGTHG